MSQIFVCDDHKGEMCGLGEVLEHLRKKHVPFLKRQYSWKSLDESAVSWDNLNCSSKLAYDIRRFKSNQDTWNHLRSSRHMDDHELSKIKLLTEKLDNDKKNLFLMEFPGSEQGFDCLQPPDCSWRSAAKAVRAVKECSINVPAELCILMLHITRSYAFWKFGLLF